MNEKEMNRRKEWAAIAPELIGLWKEGQRAKEQLEASPDLPENQQCDLTIRYFDGEDAVERIVAHYQNVVQSIVQKHVGKGIPWKELMQAGNLGLSEALVRYDPEKGKNPITFAYKRIRGSIIDFLRDNSPVSRGTHERIQEMDEVRNKLLKNLSREPTDAELAAKMGIDECEVREIQRISEITCTSLENLLNEEDRETGVTSDWDKFISSNEGNNVEGWDDQIDLAQQLAQQAKVVKEAMEGFFPRERKILQQIFKNNSKNISLKEIGNSLGLTESRMSQIWREGVMEFRKAAEEKGLVEPDPSFCLPLLSSIRNK